MLKCGHRIPDPLKQMTTETTSPRIGELLTPGTMPARLQKALRNAGYSHTPADTWGRVVGGATAFLEVGTEGCLAWLYSPEKEAFIGPRLHVAGLPEEAATEALRQLMLVLGSHETGGAEDITLDAVWETVA